MDADGNAIVQAPRALIADLSQDADPADLLHGTRIAQIFQIVEMIEHTATQNLYGGVAACSNTTMRPEVDGITCPLTGTAPTAPSAPTGVRIIR